MADAMNHVRAMRLAEIVQEFSNLQHYISQIHVEPTPEEYYGDGYVILRECMAEAKDILDAPFTPITPASTGDAETERAQLAHVILDASARRFQAQRIWLRATAAMRWVNSRAAALQGQPASASNAAALQTVDAALRNELDGITDKYVVGVMRSHDQQQGRWVDEDPSVGAIRRWFASSQ